MKHKDICSICGITSDEYKAWNPHCKMTGKEVCDKCCFECKYHKSWSGLWKCIYKSDAEIKAEARARKQSKMDDELARISAVYWQKKREKTGRRKNNLHR